MLLIGTEATDNELNEECGGYENISTGFEMAPTNWKMVHYLEKSVGPPHHTITADWLDGIVVAMNYLKSLEYEMELIVRSTSGHWTMLTIVIHVSGRRNRI